MSIFFPIPCFTLLGKNFKNQDQIGTEYCLTVDKDSVSENAVTVRSRNSKRQERVLIDSILKKSPFDYSELGEL